MYTLYSILAVVAVLLASPWLLYQALRYRKYVASLPQRLGLLPVSLNIDGERTIWVHAVSVGEVLSTRPLLAALRARYPELRLVLTTTTMAGQQLARRTVREADEVFFFPFDLGPIVRRTLDVVKPRLFVTVETELWPVLLRECRRRGVKTMVVNGRLSSRSFPRYRLVRPFMRRVLQDVDRLCVQSEESARRFVEIGADPARITVTGSLKFDAVEAGAGARGRDRVLRYFRFPGTRPVFVAGSTMRGEEAAVLRAFRRVRASVPATLLLIAPRHPERFDEVEQLCREEGWKTQRRTALAIDAEPAADVVVLDTIGELATLYQVATVVFVGGSLVPTGGHNVLEPAVFGKPIVFGPYMDNFREIADACVAAEAAIRLDDEGQLEREVVQLLTDPVKRARLGAAARALVDANRGAKDRTMSVIEALVPPAGTSKVVPFRPIA
jgi:3-deoxy-D-manno-octulosonic-acid transferase